MKHIWDVLGLIVVTVAVMYMLIAAMKPYIPIVIIGALIIIGVRTVNRSRYW